VTDRPGTPHVPDGCEWIVDAYGCDAEALRSRGTLEALVAQVLRDLALTAVAPAVWHQFPGPGGLTGVVVLAESHFTCHTFPERGFAAFNLYCCRPRAPWPWATELTRRLSATEVSVVAHQRGTAGLETANATVAASTDR
jgi:S-adenosylmethionine decarboxylase